MRVRQIEDEGDDDKRVLEDGEKLTIAMTMMDAASAALHRPGFRLPSSDAQDATQAAYEKSVEAMSNAWRSPAQVEADTEAACFAARDAVLAADDAQKISDAAYHRMVDEMRNAWKARG